MKILSPRESTTTRKLVSALAERFADFDIWYYLYNEFPSNVYIDQFFIGYGAFELWGITVVLPSFMRKTLVVIEDGAGRKVAKARTDDLELLTKIKSKIVSLGASEPFFAGIDYKF